MAQNASVRKRSGDDYYTTSDTILKIISRFGDMFKQYDYVWIPFNSDDKPIVAEMRKFLGDDRLLTLPESCYCPELGFKDFFKWKDDISFFNLIKSHKVLCFDNPPFSKWSKIVREELIPHGTDYILFGDSLTALNRVRSFRCGYRILGRVPFENCEPNKRVNIALFSNLFDDIKYEFGIGTDKADLSNGTMEWSERVNIPKYIERGGEISSAEIVNVCLRNYTFHLSKIDFSKKSKKFGGGVFYNFE